jgi:hypothetical protein
MNAAPAFTGSFVGVNKLVLTCIRFSEIPDRPKNHTRYHRYVKLVRAAEAQLVKYLVGINRDIARRARLRGITPK